MVYRIQNESQVSTIINGTEVFRVNAAEASMRAGIELAFYNVGEDEHGEIYRDDNYLYILAGTGGDLYLQAALGTYIYAGATNVMRVFATNVNVRYGLASYWYNAGETEHGQIYRDNNYLYVDSGTGGLLEFDVAGVQAGTFDANLQFNVAVNSTSYGIKIGSTRGYLALGVGTIIDDGNRITLAGSRDWATTNTFQMRGGQEIFFYNAGNSEYGSIYRDDNNLYVDSGTGGNLAFLIAGTGYAYITSTSFLFRGEDTVIYNYLDTYSTTNTDRSIFEFRKSSSGTLGTQAATENGDYLGTMYFMGCDSGNVFDTGAGIDAIQNGAAGTKVPTDLNFGTASTTSFVYWFIIRNDGDIETRSGTSIEFYNAGNTEYGEIYRDDGYLYVRGGTGGGLALGATGNDILLDGSTIFVNDLMSHRGGVRSRWYNAGNTEYGSIYRDDDYLYIDSGTGGQTKFYVAGTDVAWLTSQAFYMRKAAGSAYIQISCYSDADGDAPTLNFYKSHVDTLGTDTATTDGDVFGLLAFYGVSSLGGADTPGAFIQAIQVGAAGAGSVATNLKLWTFDDALNENTNQMVLLSDGNIEMANDLDVKGDYYNNGSQGWSGTFTNGDGDTVTVQGGIIIDVS